jgi:uncharacterized membrane protein YGL010W
MSKLFDFKYQFVSYGEYHDNTINQIVHIIFVPILIFTAQIWMHATPELYVWKFNDVLPINASVLLTMVYCLYYIRLHRTLGVILTPVLLFMSAWAFNIQKSVPNVNYITLGAHATSWFFQIMAHKVFEGRAPAFLDNPLQAVVLAPFFVFCEILFKLGFFPTLAKDMNKLVKAKLGEYKRTLNKKSK